MHMETGTTRRSFLVGTGVALGTAVGAVALFAVAVAAFDRRDLSI